MDEAQDPKCKYVSIWGCFGNLWVCLGHIITGARHEQRLRGHIVAYASVRDGDAADLGRGQETLLCSADAAAPRRPPRRAPRGRLSQGLPEAGKACQAARAIKNGWRGATSWCSSQLQLSRSPGGRRTQSEPVRTAPLWWKSGVCPKTGCHLPPDDVTNPITFCGGCRASFDFIVRFHFLSPCMTNP